MTEQYAVKLFVYLLKKELQSFTCNIKGKKMIPAKKKKYENEEK